MRWNKSKDWGPSRLAEDEWAVLEAEILAHDLEAVEYAVEEITGFMDAFREDVDGRPMVGVTDGQLAVVSGPGTDTWGRRAYTVTFCASGPVGRASPDAFERLASAASELVDHVQTEGIAVEQIRWRERPYIKRAF